MKYFEIKQSNNLIKIILLFLSIFHIACIVEAKRSIKMATSRYEYMMTKDGAKIRVGHWTPSFSSREDHLMNRNLPTMVVLQGRASSLEKFEEIIHGLLRRGYDVWALDWRGQGVSSRLTNNPQKGYIDSYETYLNDLNQFLNEYVKPHARGEIIALGQSMGAHIGLRYMHDHPGIFDAGIFTAPMLDVQTGGYPKLIARILAKLSTKMGLGEAYVFGHDDYSPTKEHFEDNFLTHDRERFFRLKKLHIEHPDLTIGGVTFGWLNATFDSIEHFHQKDYFKNIRVPVFLIAAGEEQVVDNASIKKICEGMPFCSLKVYPQARHQILSEVDAILKEFWQDFDRFMNFHFANRKKTALLAKDRVVESAQLSGVKVLDPSFPKNVNGF